MGDEIIAKEKAGLVGVINAGGLDKILEPLVKEIHLFDTYVAGTTHLEDQSVLDIIQDGDELTLRREEDNRYDDKAILIFNADMKKLGYVPEKDNIIFSRLMDAGKLLKGRIGEIEKKGSFTKIKIGIYLVDF